MAISSAVHRTNPSENSLPVKSQNITSLQAGRAVAALLVVLVHASVSIFALPKYWNSKPFGNIFDFGHSGVEFFFVLSGFILLHVHRQDFGVSNRLVPFLYKRFCRIYPLYWIVLAGVTVAFFANTAYGKGHEREPLVILSSLLLVHLTPKDPVLPVSWTLFHEIYFYALLAVCIHSKWVGVTLISIVLVGTTARLFTGGLGFPFEFVFSPYNALFAMGAAIAFLNGRPSTPAPCTLTAFGLCLFAWTAYDEVKAGYLGGDSRILLYGLGSALIMFGLAGIEREGRLRVWPWLQFLGSASYSIYLAHFPIQSLLAKLFVATRLNSMINAQISFVIVVMMSILIGAGLHVVVERPLLSHLKYRTRS